ncbi:PilD-dependent protein PddA [Variovorax sp. PBL-H6]|uniref:type II secretion system protein n=1 Tax=Variovorax sp. PBL-H6 TaxID=434009 RepID=UPI001316BEE1|nr:prepilin-type N-terminal cleavage/methylation domain-containing protein [Variovorax sp. PBL-H6]VTU36656.1 PilD-dependent protein PddA [Variovorax sp. PBL-H6]
MRGKGFTLIELLVVMAILSALLTIVAPRYMRQADRAKEAALRENLEAVRIALDQFYGDRGSYPERLADLVALRYLRAVPLDPVTERRDSWVLQLRDEEGGRKVIHDIHSGAAGNATDGTPFKSW